MAVRLKTGCYWYTVGSEELLHSFFSTIAYHLEDNHWGSKYPSIMKDLYHGQLYNIDHAICELNEIRGKLEEYTQNQIVWDINDMKRRPPWEDNSVENITTLSESFISLNGENLFALLQDVFNKAREIEEAVEIITF